MRVTNQMMSDNFMADLTDNLQNLKDIDSQLTSGKQFKKPSDNPFKVARTMQLYTDIDANKQFKDNIKETINWLDTTDTTLGQAGNAVQRIRELLVASGNAAYSSNERKAIKDEINQKISQFAEILNTNFDGKYIFGGSRVTVKPIETTDVDNNYISVVKGNASSIKVDDKFKAASNTNYNIQAKVDSTTKEVSFTVVKTVNGVAQPTQTIATGKTTTQEITADFGDGLKVTFSGDKTEIKDDDQYIVGSTPNKSLDYHIEDAANKANELNMIDKKLQTQISAGVTMEYNVTAKDISEFKNNKGENKNLFNIFQDIVTHLDDPTAVSKLQNEDLQNLTDSLNHVLTVRAEVGAKQNRMEAAKDINEDQKFNMTEILSATQDIDFTEKNMEFAVAQTIYLASLQTGAKIIQPSLMDYLR